MVGDNRTNRKQETDSSDDDCKLGPHRTNLHARVSTSRRESAHTLTARGGHRRQRVLPKPLYACRAAFPKTSRPGRSVVMSSRCGAPAQSVAEFFARQIRPQSARLAAWLALSLAAAGCANPPSSLVAQRLHPCPSDRGLPDAYCGSFSVFED